MHHVDYRKHKQLRRQMIYDYIVFGEQIKSIFFVNKIEIEHYNGAQAVSVTVTFDSGEVLEQVAHDHKALLHLVKNVNMMIADAYDTCAMSEEDMRDYKTPIKCYNHVGG